MVFSAHKKRTVVLIATFLFLSSTLSGLFLVKSGSDQAASSVTVGVYIYQTPPPEGEEEEEEPTVLPPDSSGGGRREPRYDEDGNQYDTSPMRPAAPEPLTEYCDVPAGIWYEDTLRHFLDKGWLDDEKACFDGANPASRAEVSKLIVLIDGGVKKPTPEVSSFEDVDSEEWYYGFVEDAASRGWMRGYGNCYGTRPCFARPGSTVTRAEAAALIIRAFNLKSTRAAPRFEDNVAGPWYERTIQIAADHCILQGDAGTNKAFPERLLNRAEMVEMLHRAQQDLSYEDGCPESTTAPHKQSSSNISTQTQQSEYMFINEIAQVEEPLAPDPNSVIEQIHTISQSNNEEAPTQSPQPLYSRQEEGRTVALPSSRPDTGDTNQTKEKSMKSALRENKPPQDQPAMHSAPPANARFAAPTEIPRKIIVLFIGILFAPIIFSLCMNYEIRKKIPKHSLRSSASQTPPSKHNPSPNSTFGTQF
ncbi:S-layer homology domain-containing protein [Patescibacteria group bacterium]|nr:S-layer homology domain-containing protein [Patescibacteria group bacterium]